MVGLWHRINPAFTYSTSLVLMINMGISLLHIHIILFFFYFVGIVVSGHDKFLYCLGFLTRARQGEPGIVSKPFQSLRFSLENAILFYLSNFFYQSLSDYLGFHGWVVLIRGTIST